MAGGIIFGIAAVAAVVFLVARKKETVSAVLSYDEVMKYFIAHKNDNPAIVKGALLKEAVGGYLLLTQTFLDKNDQPVFADSKGKSLGCKRKVKRLDNELLTLFKDANMIVVE